MAITIAQVDTQIGLAWAALRVDEIEYEVRGRTLRFRTLPELQEHINWLMEMRQQLVVEAAVSSGDPICPVVSYQDTE